MAGETAKKAKKAKMPNTWIIGLVLIVLVLGGAGLYQMKQKNALQAKLDQKEGGDKSPKDNNTTSLGGGDDKDNKDDDNGTSLG